MGWLSWGSRARKPAAKPDVTATVSALQAELIVIAMQERAKAAWDDDEIVSYDRRIARMREYERIAEKFGGSGWWPTFPLTTVAGFPEERE